MLNLEEMKMNEYNMNFHEVLRAIFTEGGWYQGNGFKCGVFIKLDRFGIIRVYEYAENKFGEQDCGALTVNDGIYNQHYRRVYTQPEIMRKC
jgi:hypothetical protein